MHTRNMFIAVIVLCAATMVAVRASAQDDAPATKGPSEFQDRLNAANLIMGTDPNLQGMRTLCIDLKGWGAYRGDLAKAAEGAPAHKGV